MRSRTRLPAPPAAALALALVLGVACAGTPSPESPLPAASSSRWRLEADGRRYVVRRLPKVEGRYEVRPDGTVRYAPFSIYRMEGQDARFLYVRVYEPAPGRASAPAEASKRVTCEVPGSDAGLALERVDSGLPARGQWREGFALADLDGDGQLDLVHGPPRKDRGPPRIFRGDGAGGFCLWTDARFPPLPYDYGDAAAGDLDGDGHADLVLAVHLRGLLALVGDGRGTFREGPPGLPFHTATHAEAFGSRAVELGDWDGDGRLDVLALADRPLPPGRAGYRVFRNLPGRFEEVEPDASGDEVFGDDLALLPGGGVILSSGVLGATELLRAPCQGRVVRAGLPGARARGFVRAVAAGDGLVVAGTTLFDESGRYAVLDVRREGSLEAPRCVLLVPGGREIVSAAVGDASRDGRPDVAALYSDGTLILLLGDGGGSFPRMLEIPPPGGRLGCGGRQVRMAELSGSGWTAIVASFSGEGGGAMLGPTCSSGGSLEVWRTRPVVVP